MPREAEPSLSERTFVLKALEDGLRTDSRKFEQYRSRDLSFGDEYGVADVKFGKTRYFFQLSEFS
jgi:exosome complex component RRP45